MSPHRVEKMKSAKRFCWETYGHKKWFRGARMNTDRVDDYHIELLHDAAPGERFTYAGEHDGVRIATVRFNGPHPIFRPGRSIL